MRRLQRSATLWLLVLFVTPFAHSISEAKPQNANYYSGYCNAKTLKQTVEVDGYRFRSYRDIETGHSCFYVEHSGKTIFRLKNDNGGRYFLGQHSNPAAYWNVPDIADGKDVTGLGYPDMIVLAYSGGAHCCLTVYLFQLKPRFHLLAKLNAEDSDTAYFADSDHNHHYFFYADDWTFAYWPSSFAGSPVAPIVLKFVRHGTSGSYRLALDKMRTPAPSPKEWKADLKEARSAFSQGAEGLNTQPALWSYVMRLIYSGHSEMAWEFLDEAWPAKVTGKADWTGYFCSVLKTSPYWPDLKPTVRDMPAACASARPSPNR
jgi:hypothetical protein